MLKAIHCPHCRKLLLTSAQEEVLKRAKRAPTSICELVKLYALWRACSYLSARKAVERMADAGILTRVRPGVYRAGTRYVGRR